MMRFDILTLFCEMMDACLDESIIGRAKRAGYLEIHTHQIRDFSKDKHHRVDDYPYGGGPGMLMQVQPIYDAFGHVCEEIGHRPHLIYLSAKGQPFTAAKAKALSAYPELCLLCGHYEGVDERVLDLLEPDEISLGDFVLTGGEIAALAVVDAVSRFVPGVLSSSESYLSESHMDGLLEYPQYTRPEEFMGLRVPEVLLSGHHAKIKKWQQEKALEQTRQKRPDLYEKYREK